VGTIGAEGGEEPDEAAQPIGAAGKIEAGAEDFERGEGIGLGFEGQGRGEIPERRLEAEIAAVFDGPAFGDDGDTVAGGVGEIDEESVGTGRVVAGADAEEDLGAEGIEVVEGAGFEEVEDVAEGVRGGERVAEGEVLVEEPVAEGGGAEGDGLEGVEVGEAREEGEGTVIGGGKDLDGIGDLQDVLGRRHWGSPELPV
jgi:hypothetical protein